MRSIDQLTNDQAMRETGAYPVQLVKIIVSEDDSQGLYLTTCYRDINHEGNTYIASSTLLELSTIEETADVKTNAISIRLNAVQNTIISVLNEVDAIGGRVTIYQGFFDTNNNTIAGEIYNKWEGVINSHSVDEDNSSGTVNIDVECKNIVNTILTTKNGRFTSDTAISRTLINGDPSRPDRSAEFVASLVDFNPFFGRED